MILEKTIKIKTKRKECLTEQVGGPFFFLFHSNCKHDPLFDFVVVKKKKK